MKLKYSVTTVAQSNGDHEVHNEKCSFYPSLPNRKYLGEFEHCTVAVNEAKKHYSRADGCKYCSPGCHTR